MEKTTLDHLIHFTVIRYDDLLKHLNMIKKHSISLRCPELDLRLCIDKSGEDYFSYCIRTGNVSYAHSDYCGARILDKDTNCTELIEDLINQVLEQADNQ